MQGPISGRGIFERVALSARWLVVVGGLFAGCASFAAKSDAPGAADSDAATAACPSGHGPVMVRAGAYCIDATEVTRGQYEEFVLAKNGDSGGQPAACAGNTSFEPSESWPVPPGSEKKPVDHVDWCDAYAFCQWAGKRLCGRIGGGPMEASDIEIHRADKDQWTGACTGGGAHAYPYGDAYEAGRCNVAKVAADIAEVGDYARCEGGYPGLFDMSGNVEEWEDACTTNAPDAQCFARSSGFYEDETASPCGTYRSHPRLGYYFLVGIRCCAP